MIKLATGAPDEIIDRVFIDAKGHVKTAIVMLLADVDYLRAAEMLKQSAGYVRQALVYPEDQNRKDRAQ